MSILGKNTVAPDFALKTQSGDTFTLSDYRGRGVVLFFYPKDDTGGCTNENLAFAALYDDFAKLNVQVAGISPDTVEDHKRFYEKFDLRWPLIADPEHKAIVPYGVWGEKKNFGKTYMGLVRSTVLIAPDGVIAQSWTVSKVDNHAENVLEATRQLIG